MKLAPAALCLLACSTPTTMDDAGGDRGDTGISQADRAEVSGPTDDVSERDAPDDVAVPTDTGVERDAIVMDVPVVDTVVPDASVTDSGVSPADSASPMCPPPGPMTANSTVAGATTTPSPTLRNLSIEWAITGDANNNGVVSVRYRRRGEATYRSAMPLRRVPAGSTSGFSWANRHSGSIFDLEPDTEYEIELSLLDPDGGCAVRTLSARTRPVPVVAAGAVVRPVTPATFVSVLNMANPGDVLEMAAGNYAPFTIMRDGAAGRPITLRSSAGAVVTGNIDMFSRRDIRIEGLTIRGRVRFNSCSNITIVRNTVETTGDGIVSLTRSENSYIADNIVRGASRWELAAFGVSGTNVGEGIMVTGPGHVVEHNRVTGFRDGISFHEDAAAVDQHSIDVVENDIDNAGDDGIEADFCAHNCRIVRNRLTNTFIAMSSQPSLGGPNYFVRNVAYNVILSAFKLQRTSYGDVLLHNTVVKNGDAFGVYTSEAIHFTLSRNNLFIGGPGGMYNGYSSGTGQVLSIATAQPSCDLDYDGFGSTTGMFTGRLGSARFSSLAELRAMTTERRAVSVDLSVFAASVAYPSAVVPAASAPDVRLRAASAAVDVGVRLANVNDGFAGAAPDLGAYELGSARPAYGPR